MENRVLKINVISASDLKDVNIIQKMDVYVVVSISGDPQTKQKTHVDREAGKNPTWNFPMKFIIADNPSLHQNNATVVFTLRCQRNLGDKDIGEVHVPIGEFLPNVDKPVQFVSYQIRKPSGKPKGVLNISYKFDGKVDGVTTPVGLKGYPAPNMGPSSVYSPYGPPVNMPCPPLSHHAPLAREIYVPPLQPPLPYQIYPPPPNRELSQPPPPSYKLYPSLSHKDTQPSAPPCELYPPPPSYGIYPPPPQPQYQDAPPSYEVYPLQPQPGYGYPSFQGYGQYPKMKAPSFQAYPPMPTQMSYPYPSQPGYGYPPQHGYGYTQ